MIARVCSAGIAFLAVFLASPCQAAEAVPDTAVRTGSAPGRGGIGGLLGASLFFTRCPADFSAGALPRFDFDGHFRYAFSRRLRFQVSPAFTWAAYSKNEPPPFVDPVFPAEPTKEHYLTLLVPVSAQLQLTWGRRPWHYFAGGGPGLYRLLVQHRRKVLRDPASLELHRNLYWGLTLEAGVERFLAALPNTSVEVAAASHFVFSEDGDRFPSGWSSNMGALALRAGGNYYFDLARRKPSPELPLPGGVK